MRQKPGEHDRVQRMIAAQTQKRMMEFEGDVLKCPNMVKTEDEIEPCGCQLFEQKPVVAIQYMPEIVCGQPGGMTNLTPIPFLQCIRCGYLMPPNEWQPLARQAYEEQNKVISPGEMKPGDNGED